MAGGLSASEVFAALSADGFGGLRAFLVRQRWFAAKTRGVDAVRVADWAVLDPRRPLLLFLLDVDGDRYFLPVAVVDAGAGDAIARVGSRSIVDAHGVPELSRVLLDAIATGRDVRGARGRFVGRPLLPWAGPDSSRVASIDVRLLSGEQSNTSIALGRELILKSFRRPRFGVNPEIEMTRFLTERTAFRHAPALVGWMDYAGDDGDVAAVAVVQGFIANSGDGWRYVLTELGRDLDSFLSGDRPGATAVTAAGSLAGDSLIRDIECLGAVTGGLHAALASDASDTEFAPEPVTPEDRSRWTIEIGSAVRRLSSIASGPAPDQHVARALRDLVGDPETVAQRIARDLDLLGSMRAHKIRCHGDYHLGQVLKTPDAFAVIDFEGEPLRSLDERRAKQSPLRDVAGMLRSFNYAASSALLERPPEARARAGAWLEEWERRARDAFLDGYLSAVAASRAPLAPPSRRDLARACAPFEIDKACYELDYELNNRPAWVQIPLAGLTRLLAGATAA